LPSKIILSQSIHDLIDCAIQLDRILLRGMEANQDKLMRHKAGNLDLAHRPGKPAPHNLVVIDVHRNGAASCVTSMVKTLAMFSPSGGPPAQVRRMDPSRVRWRMMTRSMPSAGG